MTKAMPFLQKAILLSYDPRRLCTGFFLFRFVGGFYYIVPHYDIIRVIIILGLWPVAA